MTPSILLGALFGAFLGGVLVFSALVLLSWMLPGLFDCYDFAWELLGDYVNRHWGT